MTKKEMELGWAAAHMTRLHDNRADIVNFLKEVNSAHAYKMAEEAVRIEAWKVDEPDDPFKVPERPENIQSVHQLRECSMEDSWIRLLFHYADGKTDSEDFWNIGGAL